MDTITTTETTAPPVSRVNRLRNSVAAKVAAVTGALFSLSLIVAAPANAAYVDPTAGAGDGFIDGLKDYFLNEVVVKALGLMVIVVSISVLVSWGRKAIKSR